MLKLNPWRYKCKFTMQYTNIDIAIHITTWITSVSDMRAVYAANKLLHAAISYRLNIAKIKTIKSVSKCAAADKIGHCGGRKSRTVDWCKANHKRQYAPITHIRGTLGYFLAEVMPWIIIDGEPDDDYGKLRYYRCIICNKSLPSSWSSITAQRLMLTFDGDTVNVEGGYECSSCQHKSPIITLINGMVGVKLQFEPRGENLCNYKQIKQFFYTTRRKKYNFVFN
ncbi:hypothetical protein D5b_00218 [Faustovirus]|nr:hypothetical protein D5b_00218 [Faustovirus]AMN84696.1 hypothetical protein D6_00293 [Faustovirus]AMP44172.1 hypothetical protein PRJ_Dakar_00216 [Faustovirus]